MRIVLLLALIGALIYVLWLIIHNLISKHKLKHIFKSNNVIVFGKKGKGKDLLFQEVINIRKQPYYSNIDYGGERVGASPLDLELGSNTYDNFIKDKIEVIDKETKPYEGKDFYFSDCGVMLPSQYDTQLHKTYKGFPIAYALSRHLWANNVHCNTQSLDRVWKALREQADNYIKCRGVTRFLWWLKVDFTIYDKYSSAREEVAPLSKRLTNSLSVVEVDKFKAQYGLVEDRFVFVPVRKITYDTRHFHKVIFGKKFSKEA